MINCKRSKITKRNALKASKASLTAMVKSPTNKIPPQQVNEVVSSLMRILEAKMNNDSRMTESDIRVHAQNYLPVAIASVTAKYKSDSTASFNADSQASIRTGTDQSSTPVGINPRLTDGEGKWEGYFVGNSGGGSPFDPLKPPPAGSSVLPSRRVSQPSNSLTNLSDGAVSSTINVSNAFGGSSIVKSYGVAVPGIEVTPEEVRDYFNGRIPLDNDTFVIAEWIGRGKNPMLLLSELSYAKRLHEDVILPCVRYYKNLFFGDPEFAIRLGQIIAGIMTPKDVHMYLSGSVISRHVLGQAVNFKVNGVEPNRVVEDIAAGNIQMNVGTFAITTGIHASLPFYANGVLIEKLHLFSDNSVNGFVGYNFT